jgi:hypothetical protein
VRRGAGARDDRRAGKRKRGAVGAAAVPEHGRYQQGAYNRFHLLTVSMNEFPEGMNLMSPSQTSALDSATSRVRFNRDLLTCTVSGDGRPRVHPSTRQGDLVLLPCLHSAGSWARARATATQRTDTFFDTGFRRCGGGSAEGQRRGGVACGGACAGGGQPRRLRSPARERQGRGGRRCELAGRR